MYKFYVGDMLFPVPPAELQYKYAGQNKTYVLINGDEINVLHQPLLMDISCELLLPNVPYYFADYGGSGFKKADPYLTHLHQLFTSKKPFFIKLVRSFPDGKIVFSANQIVNIECSMEAFDIVESAENGYDVTVSLKFKKYKHFGTKTVSEVVQESPIPGVQQVALSTQRETSKAPDYRTYTVLEGDTLYVVALKAYGNGDRWTQLFTANKASIEAMNEKVGGLTADIHAGQVLTIPRP